MALRVKVSLVHIFSLSLKLQLIGRHEEFRSWTSFHISWHLSPTTKDARNYLIVLLQVLSMHISSYLIYSCANRLML